MKVCSNKYYKYQFICLVKKMKTIFASFCYCIVFVKYQIFYAVLNFIIYIQYLLNVKLNKILLITELWSFISQKCHNIKFSFYYIRLQNPLYRDRITVMDSSVDVIKVSCTNCQSNIFNKIFLVSELVFSILVLKM